MIVLRKLNKHVGVSTDIVLSGALIGTANGNNKVFYTEYNYKSGKITVNFNGQELITPEDFDETGLNEITFIYIAPDIDDVLSVSYHKEVL